MLSGYAIKILGKQASEVGHGRAIRRDSTINAGRIQEAISPPLRDTVACCGPEACVQQVINVERGTTVIVQVFLEMYGETTGRPSRIMQGKYVTRRIVYDRRLAAPDIKSLNALQRAIVYVTIGTLFAL